MNRSGLDGAICGVGGRELVFDFKPPDSNVGSSGGDGGGGGENSRGSLDRAKHLGNRIQIFVFNIIKGVGGGFLGKAGKVFTQVFLHFLAFESDSVSGLSFGFVGKVFGDNGGFAPNELSGGVDGFKKNNDHAVKGATIKG